MSLTSCFLQTNKMTKSVPLFLVSLKVYFTEMSPNRLQSQYSAVAVVNIYNIFAWHVNMPIDIPRERLALAHATIQNYDFVKYTLY